MFVLTALILYLLVFALARGSVRAARWRLLGVVTAVVIVNAALEVWHTALWPAVFTQVVVEPFIIAYALMTWCAVPRRAAIEIGVLYIVVSVVLAITLQIAGVLTH